MRTTINLDDHLIEQAQRVTGRTERTSLIHDGLRALIARANNPYRMRKAGHCDRLFFKVVLLTSG